jgi:Flp pilus assembly protein TadG
MAKTAQTAKRWWRDQSGAAAVELALALPVVVGAFLAVAETGRVFWTRSALEYAVEETGRKAMINKDLTTTQLQQAVRSGLSWINPSSLDILVSVVTDSGKQYTSIDVTHHYVPLSGYLDVATITLHTSVRVPRSP